MPAITYHPQNPLIYITDSEFWKNRNIPMSLSLSLSLSLNSATLLMILQNTYQGRKERSKQYFHLQQCHSEILRDVKDKLATHHQSNAFISDDIWKF
jgi:hypothetical protein